MIRLTQLRGQRVITKAGAQQLGSIRRLLVDAQSGTVVSAELEGASGAETILDWSSVATVGRDAVMVESAESVRGPRSEIEQRLGAGDLDLLGKLVLDESGDSLGTLEDIEFDETTGRLAQLFVPGHSLPLERLVAIGPDAVIVPLPQSQG